MEPKAGIDPRSLLEHKGFVRAVVRGILADEHAVDDIVQETCLRALERPPRTTAVRSWLARVGRNLALSALRREKSRQRRERAGARPEAQPSASEAAASLEQLRLVVEAVLALEEPFRSAILLRFYEDLPPKEIARQLGVPVDTVRSRLRRGLERMRAWFDERHGGNRAAWSVALLPLLGAREAAVAVAAGTGATTATAGGGAKALLAKGAVMSMKAKLVGATLVLCAIGTGTIAWQAARERDVPPPARAEAAHRVAPAGAEVAAGVPTGNSLAEASSDSLPNRSVDAAGVEQATTTFNAEVRIGRQPSRAPPKPYRLAEPCGEQDLGALRVIVTDGTGSPLPGAKLTTGIVKGSGVNAANHEAGAHGRLELRSLEPGKWQVSAMTLSHRRFAMVEVQAGRFTEVTIVLAGGATVEGQVRHVEHGPLSNAFVRLERGEDGFDDSVWASADATGHYRLDGVPPGAYRVTVEGKLIGWYQSHPQAILEIPGPGLIVRDIVLGRITLRGTVRDADTGAPIPGVTIRFQTGWWGEATTDGDGVYAVPDLLPGSYRVLLMRDGYGTESGETGLVPAEGTLTADFELRQAAVLVLKVLDKDGRPIPGAVYLGLSALHTRSAPPVSTGPNTAIYRSSVMFGGRSLGTSVRTDAQGIARYSRIVPGLYDIDVGAERYVRATQQVDVKAGENRVTFRLDPDRAEPKGKVSLQGTVRDSVTRRPIAGARISIQSGVIKEASTDAEGVYRLRDVPPGKWMVVAEQDGHGIRFLRDVEIGDDARTLDVELDAAGTLHIHVTDRAGRPVAGTLYLGVRGRDEGLTKVGTSVEADAEGHAVYKRIVPGTYVLRIKKDGVGEGTVEVLIGLGENVVRVRLE